MNLDVILFAIFAIGAVANGVALVLAVALLIVARPRDTAPTP